MNNNQKHHSSTAKTAVLAVFFLVMSSSQAAEFSVNPVRVFIDGKAKSGSLIVENPSDQVVQVQSVINSWSQDNGMDQIAPTGDLVVSPPIFKVQPRSKQVVRIGFIKAPDATREGAYRLYLQEVPPPRKLGETGMSVALRMSLPVFISPTSGKAQAVMKWKAVVVDSKKIKLTFFNSGSAHIQVTGINISLPDGSSLASNPAMMIYILPSQSHTWDIPTDKPWQGETLRVMMKSDASAPGVETEVKPQS